MQLILISDEQLKTNFQFIVTKMQTQDHADVHVHAVDFLFTDVLIKNSSCQKKKTKKQYKSINTMTYEDTWPSFPYVQVQNHGH